VDRAEKDDRRRRAVDLHLAGFVYSEIARQLGYGETKAATTACWKDVQRGLDDLGYKADPADIRSAIARTDALLKSVWVAARRGDLAAIDRVLKLEERRDRLAVQLKSAAEPELVQETEVVVDLAARIQQRREGIANS